MSANDTAGNGTANNARSHYFHAEAHALTAKLNLPFEAQLKKQAFVKLEGDSQELLLEGEELKRLKHKRAQENYFSEHPKNYRFEGIFSYSAAHTQVSGHRSNKIPGAFVTLATSVVENLNVLNVVTADKVVAQISTTHLPDQYSPKVTFLGTHFENLRIARHKTEPVLNLAFAGTRPQGEKAIYPASKTELMGSLKEQYKQMRGKLAEFKRLLEPEHVGRLNDKDSWLSKQYHGLVDFDGEELPQIPEEEAENDAATPNDNGKPRDSVTCSLVKRLEVENVETPENARPIVIFPPARGFGHVIHVEDFGTIFLAELTVKHNSFHLTMIRLELGCIADGSASIASCNVNGKGHP